MREFIGKCYFESEHKRRETFLVEGRSPAVIQWELCMCVSVKFKLD